MYNLCPRVTDEVGDISEFSIVSYLLLQIFSCEQKERKQRDAGVLSWQHDVNDIIKHLKYQKGAAQHKCMITLKQADLCECGFLGFTLPFKVIQNFSAFPRSEFIPHPLTYVSTGLPFIQRSLLQTMRKQDTPFLFSSGPFPSLVHLFKGLSVARITALGKHTASPLNNCILFS